MKSHKRRHFIISAIFVSIFIFQASAQYSVPPKMKWWYNDRFGMFIHFGSYSFPGHGEWAFSIEKWTKQDYQTKVSAQFDPVDFNAREIVNLAKNAGMKYLVITAKHHEGFSMWDTKVASFKDVTGTTFYDLPQFTKFGKKDILKELRDACRSAGIKFGLYYSILDWNHASQTISETNGQVYSTMKSMEARSEYIRDMKMQLKELIDNYHPDILWFDGDWTYNYGEPSLNSWWTKSDGIDLYNYLIKLNPKLLINERVFRGAGLGDWMCPEQKIPEKRESRPWETCQTMNKSWGYNAADSDYKAPSVLIRQLVEVVSKDGNYLLNIGPKGDGSLTKQSVTILTEVGKWMKKYGQSIYGATGSPFATEPSWGYFTKKEGKLFVHVFDWPQNGVLEIPALSNPIKTIRLLSHPGKSLKYQLTSSTIKIEIPRGAPDKINSVIVAEVKGIPKAKKAN